ncbi:MAG: glycosyltransferase family 2 protein [Nitrospirae bacterium]|nr:glycosyltransferase family 2 protein [Nitrospirota bacterium]
MDIPTVSIIMSVYNGAKYVRKAVNSVLNQTFTDFEFIIVNDASTDDTGEILKQYGDNRITIINNSENIGLTKSLNKGIQISKGKYIARMDADDIAMPERIEKQVQFMEKNENIAILGTDYYPIDELGRRTHAKLKRPHTTEEIKKSIFLFNPFIHSTLMIRRWVFEEMGGYDERFELAQDYELSLRILSKHEGYNLPEELLAFRIDKEKLNIQRRREQIYFAILARLKVLKNGLYPSKNYIFLMKDFIKYIFPYYSYFKGKSKLKPFI